MNINQILSALRDVAKYVGAGTAGGFIIHNWFGIDPAQMSSAIAGLGAIIAFAATIWSQFDKTKASTVVQAADIVQIPAAVQKQAGVAKPIYVPTNPPSPTIKVAP